MLRLWRRPDAIKGTWRIRGTLGGRRYDESTGTDSRQHAEAIFARRQKEILDAITFGPERTTCFAEAVELYLSSGGGLKTWVGRDEIHLSSDKAAAALPGR